MNNTYLMESDTDYGKLFNSILILHHLPWGGEVTEESLMALKIHQVYLSWSKQYVTTGSFIIYVTAVRLMTLSGGLCDIYTASAVSLFF